MACLWTDYSHVTISYNIFILFETLCHGTWHVVYWYIVYCVSRTVHKSSLIVFKYQSVDWRIYFPPWGFECVILSFNDGFSDGNLMLSQTYLMNLRNQQSTIIKENLVLVTPKLYRLVKHAKVCMLGCYPKNMFVECFSGLWVWPKRQNVWPIDRIR